MLPNETPAAGSGGNQGSGPPNRPLPPTPVDDAQGDRTLIMKRVSDSCHFSTYFLLLRL